MRRSLAWKASVPAPGEQELRVDGRPLTPAAAGTDEIGMRETDHGIPLEPYRDP